MRRMNVPFSMFYFVGAASFGPENDILIKATRKVKPPGL